MGVQKLNLTNYFYTPLRGVQTNRLHRSVRHAPLHVRERSEGRTASVRWAADIQSKPCIYAQVPYTLLDCFQLLMGIHTRHIDQGFETLPGGVRTSRLD